MNLFPPPPPPSKAGPYLKLSRAYHHLNDFQIEVERFIQTEPYRVVAEQHAEHPTELAWVVRGHDQIPRHIPTIISDVIQNLRSALDLAVCAIARFRGASDKRIQFPTADSCQDFNKIILQDLKARVGADVEVILKKDIQPYAGGNGEELRTLHQLSILDKHKLLTPVAYTLALHSFTLKHDRTRPIGISNTFYGAISDGAVLIYTPHHERFQVGNEIDFTFEVTLAEGVPTLAKYQPIVPTLLPIAKSVEHALYALHRYWGPPI